MADERLRELERRWKETGWVEDEAAYLLEQHRGGALARLDLEVAAMHGGQGERFAVASLPGTLLVVHFWAEWNAYDRTMGGYLADMRGAIPGWLLHRINIDEEQNFACTCRVLSIPTLIAFHHGEEVSRLAFEVSWLLARGKVETWLRGALGTIGTHSTSPG